MRRFERTVAAYDYGEGLFRYPVYLLNGPDPIGNYQLYRKVEDNEKHDLEGLSIIEEEGKLWCGPIASFHSEEIAEKAIDSYWDGIEKSFVLETLKPPYRNGQPGTHNNALLFCVDECDPGGLNNRYGSGGGGVSEEVKALLVS